MLFSKLSRIAVAVGLALGVGAFSGCMTHPYSGQVQNHRADTLKTMGWVTKPYQKITIQVRKTTASPWVTIGTTTASGSPVKWDGIDWYYWNRNVVVPYSQWSPFFNGYATTVRALADGSPVYTFNEPFSECWSYDKTLSEVWQDCGSGGTEAVVFALK